MIEGEVTSITGAHISGWAHDTAKRASLELEVLFDEKVVGSTRSGSFRCKLRRHSLEFGMDAFSWRVPATPARDLLRYSVREKRTEMVLPVRWPVLRALIGMPPPVLAPDQGLALFFSAKAACTYAVRWFLDKVNLLEAAASYSDWIHDYRIRVMCQSGRYRGECAKLLDGKFSVIKFTRDPFRRAVSSYNHIIRYGHELRRIARFLGKPCDADLTFSFREYLQYLGSINLRKSTIHHRLQAHDLELAGAVQVDEVVQVEQAAERLPEIERKYGLPPTDLERLRGSPHYVDRVDSGTFHGDTRLGPGAMPERWPSYHEFYDREIVRMVADLYAEDFRRYGYRTTPDFNHP